MSQITAESRRAVGRWMQLQTWRSRADIISPGLERYLEDYDDLEVALERLRDPADPVLDWDRVRDELLGSD